MSVTLEFIGGPLDGEVRVFTSAPHRWDVPLASFSALQAPSECDCPIRRGTYVLGTLVISEWWTDAFGQKHTHIRYQAALRWEGEE